MISRRNLLVSTLFGAGAIGLRALATGIPAATLLKGRRALADLPADPTKAQFVVFSTSALGDPINANCPGSYIPGIVHSTDVAMAETDVVIRGRAHRAATPWSTLPPSVLDRTCFWHLRTQTPIHPEETKVLQLYGATDASEMLPSLLAAQLQPTLGTVQAQPITVGATNPLEGLSYQGRTLPIIPPLALKATLTDPAGPLSNLQGLRDRTLAELDGVYRNQASRAQRAYLDSVVHSQTQVRELRQDLLDALTSIEDNSIDSQITAAVTLIQMKVTPVVAIHIPFGGDNHRDPGLERETEETISGVAAIGSLMSKLAAAGLADQTTFMSLNVFGRTLGAPDGRQHNENHQVSITIGKSFAGGVIGAVERAGADFACTGIDPATGGRGSQVSPAETLASFGKTALAAVGVSGEDSDVAIPSGAVITGALA